MPSQPVPAVRPFTVPALLLARRHDGGTAVRFEGDAWSWTHVVQTSADRAAWLTSQRRSGPFHIGVLLDNVPEMPFILGGAALCGAVVVGLNTTRRGAQLARDVRATDCQLIVTEARHAGELEGLDLGLGGDRIWSVDDAAYAASVGAFASSEVPDHVSCDPTDLFMLIFTSGTSGEPKAVRVTHRKVAGPGVNIAASGPVTAADVVYLSMPMFHSACIMAGWAPALASGAQMVLKRRFSASQFLPDVRRYGVTSFHYVGKALSYVLATPERPDDADTTLRWANGNEAADLDIGRFATRFGCRVSDGFGSTEGGVAVLRTPDTPPGSIGRPNTGVEILDPDTLQPAEPGRFDAEGRLVNGDEAIGELVNTAGGGFFEGYYNDDAANAERMRGGMYWSGDLAYRDAAGFAYFAGRTIEWLRVDGENVAAAPVERLIARYPSVSQVAVYAVPAPDVGDEVMATLKLLGGATFDPDDFERFLLAQPDLGTKWLPRYVRIATRLPETPTNKVVKRVLAQERWYTDDPVWWREGRAASLAPLDGVGRERIRAAFEAHGRGHLLDAAAATGAQPTARQ